MRADVTSKQAAFVSLLAALCYGWLPDLGAQSPSAAIESTIGGPPLELKTVAENSGYQTTSHYDQTVAFLEALRAQFPLARKIEMGKSRAGRSVPLLAVSEPAVATPEQAAEQVGRGKLVVLLLGNSSGERADGQDALLALSRNILAKHERSILTNVVLLVVPMWNVDADVQGESREASPSSASRDQTRSGQATRLDSNRDFVKLETSETRALVRVLRQWNPALVVDVRTAAAPASHPLIRCEGPNRLAGDTEVVNFIDKTLLPEMVRRVAPTVGVNPAEDLSAKESETGTSPPMTLDMATYMALRNRLGLAATSDAGAPIRDRVLAMEDCLNACLEYAVSQREQIRKLLAPSSSAAKLGETKGKRVSTQLKPYAYVFPGGLSQVTELLQRHGIEVDEFREDIELDSEAYRVSQLEQSEREFEGHRLRTLEVTPHQAARKINAGTVLVRAEQPLRPLLTFLLEPRSGSLAAWNFFDPALQPGKDYPVLRLLKSVPILTTRVRPLAEDRVLHKPISFAAAYESARPLNLSGSSIGSLQWLDDGEHFLQTKEGKLLKVSAATGRSSIFLDTQPIAKALAGIPVLNEKTAQDLANRAGATLNKQRTAALFNYENDLYYARKDGSVAGRLTHSPQPEELATFSPDGRFVAFVRTNELYVVDLQTKTERALTTGATDRLLNGKADWVYYEEVFNRNHQAYWWSPDSQRLAFFETDDSPVKTFTLVNDLPRQQEIERTPYPRPGEPNPRVRLGLVSGAGGKPVFADLSDYDAEAYLITGVGWWPDGSALYCFIQNRTQTWLDFCSVPIGGGKPKRLFRDRTKAWVEAPAAPEFLKDGSFLLTSERSGWQHIYHFAKDGRLVAAVTGGDWEARKLERLDEPHNWVYFTGTKDSPIAENLYRVHLDGTGIERLTLEPGSHRVEVSPKGNAFIDRWSTRTMPTKVAVRKADGLLLRMLDTNPVYALEEYDWGATAQFQIKATDDFLLEAAWVKPPHFDARKKYPAWLTTYAGPHAPSISDSWGGGALWDQVLAHAGLVVFHVDPRSASGKGAQSAWACFHQLGVVELKDLSEAIQWLKAQPWIDGSRIGMSGFSYGGFMTAFAMTHSDLFAAGIAGAPPTDWRDYDTIYTERYMATPQENPEGYQKTSVVEAAKNLHGRLFLVHGTIDDNVHPANSIKFMRALQDAGKQFEMMFYPGFRHGIGSKQFQRAEYEFILRSLAP